jgi:alpha/beta superfamily hydrolase
VVCPPLGWESIQCYHGLRVLGETLASAGFATLRVDYHGTGESAGRDEDLGRVEAWTGSIHQAVEWLSALDGVSGVGLIGVRMGATLAAQVASQRQLTSLALWEPCPTGAHYAREMEILAAAAPGAGTAPPAGVAPALDAGGYVLTQETLTELAGLDVAALRPLGCPHVLLLGRADRPAPTALARRLAAWGTSLTVEQPSGFKEMMTYPVASVPAVEGFERIEAWAREHSTSAVTEEGARAAHLPARVDLGALYRRAVSFGPDGRLFGVIAAPRVVSDPRAAVVLFLTGGVVPRTSVNRMYVTLADELAQRGHPTLRFDVSGIGESDAVAGDMPRDPYPSTILDDARAALAFVRNGQPSRPAWLVGLCSGAYAAFRLAIDEPAVAGIVLLNPLHYRPLEGSQHPNRDEVPTDSYRRTAADLRRWKRLLYDRQQLERKFREIARGMRRRLRRASGVLKRGAPAVMDDFDVLREKETEVHIVFAHGDPGQRALETVLERGEIRLDGIHLTVVEGADHTFNSSQIREEVSRSIVETISPARRR